MWIIYPTYYKDTETACEVFEIIERHVKRREKTSRPLTRKSVCTGRFDSRYLNDLAKYFSFEMFSPHWGDMDCSNNSSIVLKLAGLDQTGFTYLITGDTETGRWDTINEYFGELLCSDVMAAPHHGARSGVNARTVLLVNPHTVLISAGVNNSYGHPHGAAVKVYKSVAKQVFSTNANSDGTCFFTRRRGNDFETKEVCHFDRAANA